MTSPKNDSTAPSTGLTPGRTEPMLRPKNPPTGGPSGIPPHRLTNFGVPPLPGPLRDEREQPRPTAQPGHLPATDAPSDPNSPGPDSLPASLPAITSQLDQLVGRLYAICEERKTMVQHCLQLLDVANDQARRLIDENARLREENDLLHRLVLPAPTTDAPSASGWIAVEERLPPRMMVEGLPERDCFMSETVLCYCEGGDYEVGYYLYRHGENDGLFWINVDDSEIEVTHWQPLPAGPQRAAGSPPATGDRETQGNAQKGPQNAANEERQSESEDAAGTLFCFACQQVVSQMDCDWHKGQGHLVGLLTVTPPSDFDATLEVAEGRQSKEASHAS